MVKGIAVIATGVYGAVFSANYFSAKDQALSGALELSGAKGIANLGSGWGMSSFSNKVCQMPEVKVNIDEVADATCPKQRVIDLESPLPFDDKEFDVVFASHVLEHLNNWEQALNEWDRIADYVFIVLPHPFSIGGHMHQDHIQHFSFGDIDGIREHWGAFVFT